MASEEVFMLLRAVRLSAASLAALGLLGAVATAAAGPPPPTSTNGHPVQQVAAGLSTPTSFAFGAGQVFEGDGGAESGTPSGGVFILKNGAGTKLAGSPAFVAGLAWYKGALYVSGGTPTSKNSAKFQLLKWSGWNGTAFTKRTAIYTAPKKFQGFNGIAFGPNGRLYVGVDLGLLNHNDHGPATKSPFLYKILTMKPNGQDLKVFATGIRQPWQFAFAPGSRSPLVSDLGVDNGTKNPLDAVLKVHEGDDYGFPTCILTTTNACKSFAKRFRVFPPHTDIMGMAIIGSKLYMTSFVGTSGKGPGGEVVSMPLKGGPLTPVVKGFVAPTVGLGQHGGSLYIGELTGQVFSVKP
jgi:glucose/arabinose dehydrogenase